MRNGARAFGAILVALVGAGILATVARGDQCDITVRWHGTVYTNVAARFAVLEPGESVSEAAIPDCTAGGRCAPPDETMAAFEVPDVPPEAALLVPDYYDGLFVAVGTFPELPDHPLHEAVYGRPNRPSYRKGCGATFTFEGKVTQVGPLRVDVERAEVEGLEQDGEDVRLQVDSQTQIEGFDREGIATLEPGDEVVVSAGLCGTELAGPLADLIEPAR